MAGASDASLPKPAWHSLLQGLDLALQVQAVHPRPIAQPLPQCPPGPKIKALRGR